MISIATVSQKGGVGKTTFTLNLAYAMARRGHRVLLVDTDSQGGIGLSLAGGARERPGLCEWLRERGDLQRFVLRTRLPELGILTVGEAVHYDPERLDFDIAADESAIRQLCTEAGQAGYDVAIFDTHAGITATTAAVLQSVDHAVVPLQAEPLGLRTLPHTLRAINALRIDGARVRLAAIVLTMAQDEPITQGVVSEAQKSLPDGLIVAEQIPRDPHLAQASAKGVPVGLLFKTPPPIAEAFDRIAEDIETRIGLGKPAHDDESTPLLV